MSARALKALLRSDWLTASSYRIQLLISLLSLSLTVVPVYFVARALESTMARSIQGESQGYFGFVLFGTVVIALVSVTVSVLPAAIQSGVGSGTFEGLLLTRTKWPSLVVGLTAYQVLYGTARAVLVIVAGWALGASMTFSATPLAAVVLVLLVVVHWGIGLIGGALILYFRTSGPLSQIVVVATTLLGGTYYSTTSIPPEFRPLSLLVPASYGLRAMRRLLLDKASFADVAGDVMVLSAMTLAVLAIGGVMFSKALNHARRHGTLSHS